jgi:hypothetical protein
VGSCPCPCRSRIGSHPNVLGKRYHTTLEELNYELQQQIGLPVFQNSNLFLLGHDDLWQLDHFKQVKLGHVAFSFQNPLEDEDDDIGEEVNADPLQDVKKFNQWVADFVDRFDLDEDH